MSGGESGGSIGPLRGEHPLTANATTKHAVIEACELSVRASCFLFPISVSVLRVLAQLESRNPQATRIELSVKCRFVFFLSARKLGAVVSQLNCFSTPTL